ncbi:MAG: hypothetical protein ACRCWO_10115 [Bosea sp. (in: a-proteobacteria)]
MTKRTLRVLVRSLTVTDDSDDIGDGTISMNLYIGNTKIPLTYQRKIASRFGVSNLISYGDSIEIDSDKIDAIFAMTEDDPWPDSDDNTQSKITLDLKNNYRYANWTIQTNGGGSQDGLAGYIDFATQIYPHNYPSVAMAFEHVGFDGRSINLMDPANLQSSSSNLKVYRTDIAAWQSRTGSGGISSIYMPSGVNCSVEIYGNVLIRRRPRRLRKVSLTIKPDGEPAFSGGFAFIRSRTIDLTELKFDTSNDTWNDKITEIYVNVFK